MIVDEGISNYSGNFYNFKIYMGEYVLNNPMISTQMSGVDVVLMSNGYNHSEQWLLIFKNFS